MTAPPAALINPSIVRTLNWWRSDSGSRRSYHSSIELRAKI
jgi:hypothetical protein